MSSADRRSDYDAEEWARITADPLDVTEEAPLLPAHQPGPLTIDEEPWEVCPDPVRRHPRLIAVLVVVALAAIAIAAGRITR